MKFSTILAQVLGLRSKLAFATQNASSANNIQINPVNVFWQIEAMEKLDFTGCTGSPMNNKTIHLFLASGVEHYFWANYNSTGADPAETGTAHVVAIASGAADTAIADDFKVAIAAITGFTAVRVGAVVTVCRTLGTGVGEVTTPTTSFVSPFALSQIRRGKDFNLGLLAGDIDPKFEPSNLIINAHQFGKTPLASLNQGFSKIEVETKLLETDLSKLQAMYKIYGGTVTGGSSNVLGAGTSVLGTNILLDAARLIFKPVNASNALQNFNIMLALPIPGSLTFSGEKPSELTVMWQGFVDTLINSKINAVSLGDLAQSGLTA